MDSRYHRSLEKVTARRMCVSVRPHSRTIIVHGHGYGSISYMYNKDYILSVVLVLVSVSYHYQTIAFDDNSDSTSG